MAVYLKNGRWVKTTPQKRGTLSNTYGILRGKVVKTSAKSGIFIQLDKNNQICDMFIFDRDFPKEDRIGERFRGPIFDKFHGRPLYSNWQELLKDLTEKTKQSYYGGED